MSKEFLYTLLDSMSVSGHEIPLQKKVIAEMTPHCDKIITDYTGNVVCVLNPDAPFKVMLAAHIDEIGLIVTHIQPDGLLRVSKSGGIFPGVYPGHQVAVHGYAQTVYGAVVRSKDMDKADLKAAGWHRHRREGRRRRPEIRAGGRPRPHEHLPSGDDQRLPFCPWH